VPTAILGDVLPQKGRASGEDGDAPDARRALVEGGRVPATIWPVAFGLHSCAINCGRSLF
jgi:hypothetical protein